jgi:hypothetical protein
LSSRNEETWIPACAGMTAQNHNKEFVIPEVVIGNPFVFKKQRNMDSRLRGNDDQNHSKEFVIPEVVIGNPLSLKQRNVDSRSPIENFEDRLRGNDG